MRLWVGKAVSTPLGPGKIAELRPGEDQVPPHGKPIRGVAYALVVLNRGGRRLYAAPDLREVEDDE
jgi:hypothetical protein